MPNNFKTPLYNAKFLTRKTTYYKFSLILRILKNLPISMLKTGVEIFGKLSFVRKG